jgi:cation transport ATPase
MTQDEIEGELHSLREQFSQQQQQHERQKKHWFRWGVIAACTSIVLAIFGMIIAVTAVAGPTPPIVSVLLFAALQLIVLNAALGTAGLPPAALSAWSRLSWGWSD